MPTTTGRRRRRGSTVSGAKVSGGIGSSSAATPLHLAPALPAHAVHPPLPGRPKRKTAHRGQRGQTSRADTARLHRFTGERASTNAAAHLFRVGGKATLFYPRDAHDRTERAGVSVALERGDLIGPFALITQFPLDSPYPFQRRQHLRPDQLTEATINWDSGFESLTSARLRHTRPDSNPLGHRVERSTRTNAGEGWQT